jgi:hypothetical protein
MRNSSDVGGGIGQRKLSASSVGRNGEYGSETGTPKTKPKRKGKN